MIGFDDLDTDPNESGKNAEIRKAAHIVNGGEGTNVHTCPKCNGRGFRTYGYVNITTYPCGWCKKTGKVTTKREENIARAIKAGETRKQNENERRQAFRAEYATEIEFVLRNSEWSDFYRSLATSLNERGSLTENQIASVRNGIKKAAEKRAAKIAERDASAPVVDVSAIEALFNTARENGLKRLAFRTTYVDISAAKETGRNPGALYVKQNGEYVGKIAGGKFLAASAAKADTLAKVLEVAADPLGTAKLYGKQTGKCSCCGRELTDPVSVANGIGPICESNWGM